VSTGELATRAQVEATVRGVLSDAFERPVAPGEDVSALTEPSWDSVKHIEILFMLEEALGITFPEHELPELKSAVMIVERAAAHLGVE
jgi:acyl carrier protein